MYLNMVKRWDWKDWTEAQSWQGKRLKHWALQNTEAISTLVTMTPIRLAFPHLSMKAFWYPYGLWNTETPMDNLKNGLGCNLKLKYIVDYLPFWGWGRPAPSCYLARQTTSASKLTSPLSLQIPQRWVWSDSSASRRRETGPSSTLSL